MISAPSPNAARRLRFAQGTSGMDIPSEAGEGNSRRIPQRLRSPPAAAAAPAPLSVAAGEMRRNDRGSTAPSAPRSTAVQYPLKAAY